MKTRRSLRLAVILLLLSLVGCADDEPLETPIHGYAFDDARQCLSEHGQPVVITSIPTRQNEIVGAPMCMIAEDRSIVTWTAHFEALQDLGYKFCEGDVPGPMLDSELRLSVELRAPFQCPEN